MKINTELYGLVYKNHNGRFTRSTYGRMTWPSISEAFTSAKEFSKSTKKNMKVVRLVLETIE